MRYGYAIGVPTRRTIWNEVADGVMKQIKAREGSKRVRKHSKPVTRRNVCSIILTHRKAQKNWLRK